MRVNAERLRRLGTKSMLYRCYLVARFLCDRHARRGLDKTRQLKDGQPNPFVVRGAVLDLPKTRGTEYVRPVPWQTVINTVMVGTKPGRDARRRVQDAFEELRAGAGMAQGEVDPCGIDFDDLGAAVQVFGAAPTRPRPAGLIATASRTDCDSIPD